MNCKNYRNQLPGFIRGTLPETSMGAVQTHLDSCPQCSAFAGYLRDTLEVIQLEKNIDPDPFMATRIEGILQSSQLYAGKVRTQPRLIPALAFSFFILAGVFGGFGLGKLITPPRTTDSMVASELSLIVDDLKMEPMEAFLLEW